MTELLKECSDLALLNELEKRIKENKLKVSTNVGDFEYPKRIIICMRERSDKKGFFMYLSETEISTTITNLEDYEDELYEEDRRETINKRSILDYWDIKKDKSNSKEKLKTTFKLLLSEKVRKELVFFQNKKQKEEDKMVFRYYPKGEIRANPDGTEPVYPDGFPVDMKKDKFYESREFDWSEAMSCVMMMIRGDNNFTQSVGKITTEAVSDIVRQIEQENEQ